MQCKGCNTELPKNAKVCPKCGKLTNEKDPGGLRVIAIAGILIAMVGSMLPFIENVNKAEDAFSFMNISVPAMWYLYLALLVVAIILLVLRKDKLSIIPVCLALVVFIASFVGFDYVYHKNKILTENYSLMDLLSNGREGVTYRISVGLYTIVIGTIIAVAGVFFDVLKYFKKESSVDKRYLSNSINKSVTSKIYYYRGFYIMFLPVLIMVLLFNYLPMLGCRYAFTKFIISDPYYAGLKHFVQMFTNDVFFWQAFRNTLFLSIVKLILNTGAAVVISLLLHEITNLLFKKTVQTIIYLPHFMSWVVVASVFKMILNPVATGVVNSLLIKAGIISEPIFFLGDTRYWTGTFFVMNVWKDTGWGTILFLATLSGISPDLYEAAQIDGANRWERLIYITFPALANTIITVFILNLAKVMNLFESVFVTSSAVVKEVSDVLQTYIYSKTFGGGNSDYGYSTAVGLFKSFVGMILVFGCNYASKKVRGRGIV